MLFINKLCPDWAQGSVWSFTALLNYKCNLSKNYFLFIATRAWSSQVRMRSL